MQEFLDLILNEIRGSWRHRWLALIAAWVICIAGWFLVLTMPDIFEARAQVYVDADSRLADVMGQVGVMPGVGSRVFVVRQALLGRSQLERVARETNMDLRAPDAEAKEKLIIDIRENVGVLSGRTKQDQNLYTITFRDHDREMAIDVVQTLLDTFVEDVLELKEKGSEDVTDYLQDQLAHYTNLLSDSEARLAEFKKKYVGLLPGESGDIFDRLQREMDTLTALRYELQIETDRRNELRRQLAAESPYVSDSAQSAPGVSVIVSATDQAIKELESRKSELLLTYTDRHPDVIAIKQQLEQLYINRDAEREAMASNLNGIEGVSNATSPVYQSVQISLNEAGVLIAGLNSQIGQSQKLVDQLKTQINTIPEVEAEYAELTRDYSQYKSLYDQLLLQRERERMGTVGENRDVVSFNIIDPPAADLKPVAPNRTMLLLGILVVGLGGGSLLAFVMHQLNPVFLGAKSLREFTGRPVLGIVSMASIEIYKSRSRLDMMFVMAASGSLFFVFILLASFSEPIAGLFQNLM